MNLKCMMAIRHHKMVTLLAILFAKQCSIVVVVVVVVVVVIYSPNTNRYNRYMQN